MHYVSKLLVQRFIIGAIRAPLVYTPSKTEAPLASKGLSVAAIGFESPSVIGFVSLLFGSFEKICGQEWLLLFSILVSAYGQSQFSPKITTSLSIGAYLTTFPVPITF